MKEHLSLLIEATKKTAGKNAYPGYPTKRLVIEDLDALANVTLPDGEWSTGVTVMPSLETQQKLRNQGYELDDFGRPLHPWLRDMLTDPQVGVVTGLGEYWNWGPNKAADPIVFNTDDVPKVLLIQRGDTGVWALPGGFVNPNEPESHAASRELLQETGLLITGEPVEIYSGIVADARTTAHAWVETSAFLWRVHGTPEVKGQDDALDAKWFPIAELPESVLGSHSVMIEQAIARMNEVQPSHVLGLAIEADSYQHVSGGHMAYHCFIVKTKNGDLFVKSHDKQAFTNPVREVHSKQYLHKEKLMYEHINRHVAFITPTSVDIVNDHNLVMEALSPENGWHWRAPKQYVDKYIQDTVEALRLIQDIPLPDDFHDTILPTYQTQIGEGWDSINNESLERIHARVTEFVNRMRPDFRHTAVLLRDNIPALREEFRQIPDPDTFYLTHHDVRQANLAWHPEHGTRIVDWSWAGAGRRNSDATSLLIDLHKSGHDVERYMDHFNPDHALTLIGFWLNHSLWPTRLPDDSVRFHQVVSAVSAYKLLLKYR